MINVKSKIIICIGALIMIIALSTATGNYVYSEYIESDRRELLDDYFDDEIDRETYDREMETLRRRAFIVELLSLATTWLIYIGLLLITVSIYLRIGEAHPVYGWEELRQEGEPPMIEVKEYEGLPELRSKGKV